MAKTKHFLLDTVDGVLKLWRFRLEMPEQNFEPMVRDCTRLLGFRAYPKTSIPAAIQAVPELHQAWLKGWNQALRNTMFDYEKWVAAGCP